MCGTFVLRGAGARVVFAAARGTVHHGGHRARGTECAGKSGGSSGGRLLSADVASNAAGQGLQRSNLVGPRSGRPRSIQRQGIDLCVRTYPGGVGFDPGSEHTHGEYVGPENTPNQASSKQRLIRPGWHKVGGLPRSVRCCLQRRVARRQTMCGEGGQVSVAKHVVRTHGPLHAVRYVRAMFVAPGSWMRWTRT